MPTLPQAVNQVPAPAATGVALAAPVAFDVLDTGSTAVGTLALVPADYRAARDLTAQVDGVAATFTTPQAYAAGSLRAFVGGVLWPSTELTATTFSLPLAPGAGENLLIRYVVQHDVETILLESVSVTVDGALAFASAAFQPGFGGTVEPVEGGYSFVVTHAPFAPGLKAVDVTATDTQGVTNTTSWSFTASPGVAVLRAEAITPTTVRVWFTQPLLRDAVLLAAGTYEVSPASPAAALVYVRGVRTYNEFRPSYVDLDVTEMTGGKNYQLAVMGAPPNTPRNPGGDHMPAGQTAPFVGMGATPVIRLVRATSKNGVDVQFDHPMLDEPSIRDPRRYTFGGGLAALSVSGVDRDTVSIATSDQRQGEVYDLAVTP